MARVLGVALSGPRSYEGEMRDFPYVNPDGEHDIGPDDIDGSVSVLWRVWVAAMILCTFAGVLIA